MKKSVKIGIGVAIVAIILYFVNKSKASANVNTTANNTPTDAPSTTPSKSNTPTPTGTPVPTGTPTAVPIDIVITPSGEPEKVSLKLRSMNVRGTAVNMSIWTNPYDANEYFVKLDEVLYFKWTVSPTSLRYIPSQYLPVGMTLINNNVSSAYKAYDNEIVVKGLGIIDGSLVAGREMFEDFQALALLSPEISIQS
jgi:hypothetical protein